MDITKKAVSTISAVALVASLGVCSVFGASTQASAAETNSTEVTIQVTDDMSQISWSAPTKVPLAVAGDGTIICPDDDVLAITNENVLPIHLTKVAVEASDPWTITDDVSVYAGSENDLAAFSINFKRGNGVEVKASDALSGADVSAETDLNMAYAGYVTGADETLADNVNFDLSGNVAKVMQDLSTEKELSTITWTIAPGLAS